MKKLLRSVLFRDTLYPAAPGRDRALPVWAVLLLWVLITGTVLLLRLFLHAVFSAAAGWVSGGDMEAADRILAESSLDYPLLYLLSALPMIVLPLFFARQRALPRQALGLSPLHGRGKTLLLGFGGGVLALSLVELVLLLVPDTRFSFLGFSGGRFLRVLFSLLALGAGCFGEELVFRGFLLAELTPRTRFLPALVLQALLFALLHLMNPYVSPAGFACAFLFGLCAGCLACLSGDLWLPFAFHFGWNTAVLHLFGSRLSGLSPYGGSLFSAGSLSETSLMTGGFYGPEGSLACLVLFFLLLVFLVFRLLARERNARP